MRKLEIGFAIVFLCFCAGLQESCRGEEIRNLSGTWKLSYLDGTTSYLLITQKESNFVGKIKSLGVEIISFSGRVEGKKFEFREKIPTSKGHSFFCNSDGRIEPNKLIGKTKCADQMMGKWIAVRVVGKGSKMSIEKRTETSSFAKER